MININSQTSFSLVNAITLIESSLPKIIHPFKSQFVMLDKMALLILLNPILLLLAVMLEELDKAMPPLTKFWEKKNWFDKQLLPYLPYISIYSNIISNLYSKPQEIKFFSLETDLLRKIVNLFFLLSLVKLFWLLKG